jgi:acyl carrier protein phosphodiesterase
LSRNGDILQDSARDLALHYAQLENAFTTFFPDLITLVEQHRGQSV